MTPGAQTHRDCTTAYALARIGLGINMATHGLARIGDLSGFAESLRQTFAKSWLPQPLVTATAFAIPPAELLIGTPLIVGLLLRPTLIAGMLLIWTLGFGMCLLQQWGIVADQLLYLAFHAALLACARWDRWSFDQLLGSPSAGRESAAGSLRGE